MEQKSTKKNVELLFIELKSIMRNRLFAAIDTYTTNFRQICLVNDNYPLTFLLNIYFQQECALFDKKLICKENSG